VGVHKGRMRKKLGIFAVNIYERALDERKKMGIVNTQKLIYEL
jgi:hypothetical protein